MPNLCVTSARPVSVSKNGKVKARKRKPNSLSTLGTVAGYVYPGGEKKLMKDATAQPFKKKRKKAKAKNRPTKKRKVAKKRTANRTPKKKRAKRKVARKAKANRRPAKRKTAKKRKR